ncbi:hypothetical protein [Limosilactobacillus mucosae]|uniref:hypothetical protein n=1 Tax=Limosilactobacillus mucosae TaxID=97478 RepID=UPI000EE36469|nr:hypothetical protein [Limosilactobacillus mucosae]HAM86074.1 hypothetical protein [Lactobacillus sp.]
MRIKNNKDFYRKLHDLEEDEEWYNNVGRESSLNVYMDDGNPKAPVKDVIKGRRILKEIRKQLDVKPQSWRTGSKRDAVRLEVTYYANFGLSTAEISELIGIPASTLRHNYQPFKPGETINSDVRVELRDEWGRHVQN